MTTIDATTTFYALTAPVKGYTLEDQVLGPLTLREWLHVHSGNFDEDDLAEELWFRPVLFLLSETEAQNIAAKRNVFRTIPFVVEPFTAAELLNRMRLEAMDEEGYIR